MPQYSRQGTQVYSLYQRLKELDANTFEKLCFHLLKARHPGADIRQVDGAGGDDGADSYLGNLEGGSTVWQCKSFPNGVGRKQREQIRASLNTAINKCAPKRWILCLSVDMDIKAHRWFQKLTASNHRRVEIGLWSACHIVDALIYYGSVREALLPGATVTTAEILKIVTKTGELSDDELATLTAENVHQYIARLKERNERLNYEVVFTQDRPATRHVAPPRGLIASMARDNTVVNIYPREIDALRANPLRGQLKVKGPGAEKLRDFIRTGKPQNLKAKK